MKKNAWRALWDRFSVGTKLPVLFLSIALGGILLFSWYGYNRVEAQSISNVDERLASAVERIDKILAPDFHDRALSADAIDLDEQYRNHNEMDFIADSLNVKYVYVLADVDGVTHFTASNSEDYFTPYEDAWASLDATRRDGLTRFDSLPDSEGESRSIIMRRQTPAGRYYFLGADIPFTELALAQRVHKRNFTVMAIASLVFAGFFAWIMVVMITRPLKRLSDFIETVRRNDFSSSLTIDPDLLPVAANTADEVRLLARNFDMLRKELSEYLVRLRDATAARERVEGEMRIAGDVQQSLLVKNGLHLPGADLWGAMEPAKATGGDFYDFFMLDEHRLCFCVGDVSGKGMSAAMFMATTLTLFRSRAGVSTDAEDPHIFLPRVLADVDALLAEHNVALMFVTMLVGIMDLRTGEVFLANGGHNPPLCRDASGKWLFVRMVGGSLLGAVLGQPFPAISMTLPPGGKLLLYTDGITEALSDKDEFFGEERLQEVLARINPDTSSSSRAVVETLFQEVQSFAAGRDQADDMTALCLTRP